MDISRLSQGLKIAGAAAIVLLIALFLPWYTIDGGFVSADLSLFNASGFLAFLVLLAVIAVLGIVAATAAGSLPSLPVAPAVIVAGAAILALLIVVIRVLVVPDAGTGAFDRGIGLWIGLIAAIAMTVGGVMAMSESGTSFGGEADRLKGSGSGRGPGSGGGTAA